MAGFTRSFYLEDLGVLAPENQLELCQWYNSKYSDPLTLPTLFGGIKVRVSDRTDYVRIEALIVKSFSKYWGSSNWWIDQRYS